MKKSIKTISQKHERGQIIVLIAFAMVGIVAMVGLVTDTGLLLIEYGNLKRGVDAGAVAAAQQYSLPNDQLNQQVFLNAATNFLNLNQTKGLTSIDVHSCLVSDPARPALCNQYPVTHQEDNRKLVEVTATAEVKFYFLSVIGIRSTMITASAVGEAATLDIVLVIDTSGSMAWETRAAAPNPFNNDPDRFVNDPISENPAKCNYSLANPCQPMDGVKRAALAFVRTLNFGYDRVGIVALTGQEQINGANPTGTTTRYPVQVLPLSSVQATVESKIVGLKVFQPHVCDLSLDTPGEFDPNNDPGACIKVESNLFQSVICQSYEVNIFNEQDYLWAPCLSSNVGGALRIAEATLSGVDRRLDSFWVVLALLSGPANATDTYYNYPKPPYNDGVPVAFPYGYCPYSTYLANNYPTYDVNGNIQLYPYKQCTDGRPSVRHDTTDVAPFTFHGVTEDRYTYDPDDYARDWADNLANLLSDTGVTIYTIGLGKEVQSTTGLASGEDPLAESLLKYIALEAGGPNVNHGQYFYSPTYSQLIAIFEKIADNIATKISQ